MLPSEQYQWVTQTLKWMAGVLGPARNWDVFSSSLLASVRGVLLRGQELDEFCRVCEHARRSAHESANAAIRSSQYTAALLKLSQWFASRSWRKSACVGTVGVANGTDRDGGVDLDRASVQES